MENKFLDVSIQNYDVNGYSQVQQYLLLKDLLTYSKPDLIILQLYLRNDLIENLESNWLIQRPTVSLEDSFDSIQFITPDYSINDVREKRNVLKRNSHLISFIDKKWDAIKYKYSNNVIQQNKFIPSELTYCHKEINSVLNY